MKTPGNADWMPDFEYPEKPQQLRRLSPSGAVPCSSSSDTPETDAIHQNCLPPMHPEQAYGKMYAHAKKMERRLIQLELERLNRNATMRAALLDAEAGLVFAMALAEKEGVATPKSTIPLALNATRAGLAASLG